MSEILDRLRGVATDTPDTHMALIDGDELLVLIECTEALKHLWALDTGQDQPCGHRYCGCAGDAVRKALAQLEVL